MGMDLEKDTLAKRLGHNNLVLCKQQARCGADAEVISLLPEARLRHAEGVIEIWHGAVAQICCYSNAEGVLGLLLREGGGSHADWHGARLLSIPKKRVLLVVVIVAVVLNGCHKSGQGVGHDVLGARLVDNLKVHVMN